MTFIDELIYVGMAGRNGKEIYAVDLHPLKGSPIHGMPKPRARRTYESDALSAIKLLLTDKKLETSKSNSKPK